MKTETPLWTERPEVSHEVRLQSLRHCLLWVFGVVQAVFLALGAYVYVVAETKENGDPVHDLGVAIGRELMMNRVFEYWMLGTAGSAVVLAAIYFVFKGRWTK